MSTQLLTFRISIVLLIHLLNSVLNKISLKQTSVPAIALKTKRNIKSISLHSIFDLSEVKKDSFKYSSSIGNVNFKMDFINKGCINKDYKFTYFQFLPESFQENDFYSFKGYNRELLQNL